MMKEATSIKALISSLWWYVMYVTCVEGCVVTSDVTVWMLIMSRGVVNE